MDIVIIRENEEDLYAGIEHQQTSEVVQCLKLISRPGCEKIIRYAFEYARTFGRKKVTCFTKDNIMKQTDGLFHKVFSEVAQEYPDILNDHMIIDIGTARLANSPVDFDVIVTPNLYGDVVSDVAAEIAGSVGLAGSANIGEECAMFEAIHGSAPMIAGQNSANPSGLIQASVMMLNHIGQQDVAERIQNAWLTTLEDGIHTFDISSNDYTRQRVGTREFAEAVIERLGKEPKQFDPVRYSSDTRIELPEYQRKRSDKKLVGVDVFVDWPGSEPDSLAGRLKEIESQGMRLSMITNRGIKVWPEGFKETFCTDHWRCRFEAEDSSLPVSKAEIVQILSAAEEKNIDTIKTENLYAIDGARAFSLGQGQ